MAVVTILEAGVQAVVAATNAGVDELLAWMEAEARANAPVVSGEFRDSIHVERDADGARLVSDSDHSAFVEFGTSDSSAQPTITPAFMAGMSHFDEIVGGHVGEVIR